MKFCFGDTQQAVRILAAEPHIIARTPAASNVLAINRYVLAATQNRCCYSVLLAIIFRCKKSLMAS